MRKQKRQSKRIANASENPLDFITQNRGSKTPILLKKYAYRITSTIKSAIKGSVNHDPVAKQYIPQIQELKTLPEENTDPIGDAVHTPVKGIVHRYPDRTLFKPANICAVYCRYCFHREHVGPGSEILNSEERHTAIEYIRNHPEIWEVILTGGDPLILSPRHIAEIMTALNTIEHVKVIRIHTRVPIADPERINDSIIKSLKKHTEQSVKALYMVLHINHAQEITPEVRNTLSNLHKAGINLLSQSVLLKGVNDDAEILENLYRELITLNVKPYYLHHPDLAPGTSHFRLPIKTGQKIMQELLGRLSGICQPTYMLDIPGGHGKIPLTPCFIEELSEGGYTLTDYKGRTHNYAPQTEIKKR